MHSALSTTRGSGTGPTWTRRQPHEVRPAGPPPSSMTAREAGPSSSADPVQVTGFPTPGSMILSIPRSTWPLATVAKEARGFPYSGQPRASCRGSETTSRSSSPTFPATLRHLPSSVSLARCGRRSLLPFPLNSLGMTGCTLFVSGEFNALPIPSSGNLGTLTLSIPNNSALVGGSFYNQAFVVDLPANGAGITASNAGEARIGARSEIPRNSPWCTVLVLSCMVKKADSGGGDSRRAAPRQPWVGSVERSATTVVGSVEPGYAVAVTTPKEEPR